MNFNLLLSLVILYLIIVLFRKIYNDYKWGKTPLNNFPFEYRGKKYWYSRSVAVTLFSFGKDKNGTWYVLANQRGNGTPDYNMYWNVPCGYLEFDETGEEAAQAETFEETGVDVHINDIKLDSICTSPSENKQNVSIRYFSILEDNIEKYKLTNINSELNEVNDIKFIPLTDIDKYQWAFNHLELIKQISSKVLS